MNKLPKRLLDQVREQIRQLQNLGYKGGKAVRSPIDA
jgi:hypothetical protein